LGLLQEIEKSENGSFFVGADGTLNFKNRHSSFPAATTTIFSDDGSNIPYLEVNQPVDDDLIFNVINLTRESGSLQSKEDTASQAKYLKRVLERSNLLNSTDSDVANAATFLLSKFKDALPRFSQMVLNVDTLSAANQLIVLSLELAAAIKIDGINLAITPDDFVLRFNVSDAVNSAFFRLNDSVFGVLNDDRLAY
jgi:hypothetical protein